MKRQLLNGLSCIVALWAAICFLSPPASAAAGAEAASFLEIPVGAEPASMGGAYSALASNSYAPIYNPAGLGFAPFTELTGQHLSYLESINYEFMSFIHPLKAGQALGGSAQYLGSGNITQTDDFGAKTGTFSSHFAAYTLAFGQKITDKIALGIATKWINAQIADVSANAYAADAGLMFKATDKLMLATTVSNAGTKLTFLNDGGNLPLNGKLGLAYKATPYVSLSADGIYRAYGLASGHFGAEWRPARMIAIRAGYRTDTTKELGAEAGVTAGIGLNLWGQEFAYAWLPLGDLGMTQYFSLRLKFGKEADIERNLIYYRHPHDTHSVRRNAGDDSIKETDPEYQQLIELLSRNDHEVLASSLDTPPVTR